MKELMRNILSWAKDPFGKNKIVTTHDKIISDIKVTKSQAQRITVHSEFPIGSMVGNANYRRRQNVRTTRRLIQ